MCGVFSRTQSNAGATGADCEALSQVLVVPDASITSPPVPVLKGRPKVLWRRQRGHFFAIGSAPYPLSSGLLRWSERTFCDVGECAPRFVAPSAARHRTARRIPPELGGGF